MDFTNFIAGIDDHDRRLDKIIRTLIPKSAISSLYKAIRKGFIKVNNKKQDINYKVQKDDKISIANFLLKNQDENFNKTKISTENLTSNSTKNENNISQFSKNLKIPIETTKNIINEVFSNEHIRIINKPYDFSVHGKNGISTFIEELYKSEKHSESLAFRTGPLHRLDRKTTGLLAFSNSQQGAIWFSNAISRRIIHKYYIGLCQGKVLNQEKWCDNLVPLKNENSSFHIMKVTKKNCVEQNLLDTSVAITICTPLSYGKYQNQDVTLCQFQILTGKKHQIRCQSAFHGFPLLGDIAYGANKIQASQDIFLHAYKMFFPKNNSINLPEQITAPLPQKFQFFLSDLLINWNCELIIN